MQALFSILIAFFSTLALTPLVIWVARRAGWVANPSADRWHRAPTALMGGVAIFSGFMLGAIPFLSLSDPVSRLQILAVLLGASFMFFLGLVDDLVQLKPTTKLIGQILAACLLAYSGVYFNILGQPLITIPLTVFFVVGITNAFNLLDNMDGLAAGIGTITVLAIYLLNMFLVRPGAIAILCLALAGALAGFLVFNYNPAKIFMGDSGSMFLGFTIAAISILGTWEQASNTFLILAVPVLLLGIPIFDTTFVTITRRLAGRAVSQGGRDHTSHRLVQLGMSERRAVNFLYMICSAFALIAVLSVKIGSFGAGVIGVLALIGICLFGVFLYREDLYKPLQDTTPLAIASEGLGLAAGPSRAAVLSTFILHKIRMAEVLMDFLLFGCAYIGAYLLRFDGQLSSRAQELIIYSLPIVIAVKFICFHGFGIYRRLWEFAGIRDLIAIGKAVVAGTLATVIILWGTTRLAGFSRAVFLLDGILLLVLASGSRVLLRVFREALENRDVEGRRLLIYGAGAAGEILLRELRNDPGLGYQPVGFMDDDYRKQGKRIHGLKIHGGRENMEEIVREANIQEVILAIPSLPADAMEELLGAFTDLGIPCHSMRRVSTTFLHQA